MPQDVKLLRQAAKSGPSTRKASTKKAGTKKAVASPAFEIVDELGLLAQLQTARMPEYDAFIKPFASKISYAREGTKAQLLLGVKALHSDDPRLKLIGERMIRPSYTLPTSRSQEVPLYLALLAKPETQGPFLKMFYSCYKPAYPEDQKEMVQILLKAKKKVSYEAILTDPLNQPYVKEIKGIVKALQKYDKSLVVKPLDFGLVQEGFEVLLGKKLSSFDHKKHEYAHYVYHELIFESLKKFLNPKGIQSLKTSPLPFEVHDKQVYPAPCYYDFDGCLFSTSYLVDKVVKKPQPIEAILKQAVGSPENEELYISGKELGSIITEHSLDLSKTKAVVPVAGKIQTDGTLQSALNTTLVHLHRDYLDYGSQMEVSKIGKKYLKSIKKEIKNLFRVLLASEERARDVGYYYYEDSARHLCSEIEATLQQKGSKLIASWGMTESVYDFAIIQQRRA